MVKLRCKCQFTLAQWYHFLHLFLRPRVCGVGMSQNMEEAVHWCVRAVEQGHSGAKFLLAEWYIKDLELKKTDKGC